MENTQIGPNVREYTLGKDTGHITLDDSIILFSLLDELDIPFSVEGDSFKFYATPELSQAFFANCRNNQLLIRAISAPQVENQP